MAAGDVWKKLRGTMRNVFGVGNEENGFNIKNNAGTGETRNAADDDFETLRAALIASGASINDLVPLLDLQGRIPNIEYSFDGDTPPTPGTNSGKFGICHTDGTSYNAGEVVYDNGTSLDLLPTEVVRTITTSSAVVGTLNLIANGLYAWQGSTWILKGDGAPVSQGHTLAIEVPIGTNSTYDSTTVIPDGSIVVRTVLRVDTAYDAATAATVSVNGGTPLQILGSADSKLSKVGQYESDEAHDVAAANEGIVRVAITGAPAAGVGTVIVFYVTPSA
jgi:hypothetical protein